MEKKKKLVGGDKKKDVVFTGLQEISSRGEILLQRE